MCSFTDPTALNGTDRDHEGWGQAKLAGGQVAAAHFD